MAGEDVLLGMGVSVLAALKVPGQTQDGRCQRSSGRKDAGCVGLPGTQGSGQGS